MLNDLKIMAAPWPFSIDAIKVPVQCWHGGSDDMAPPALFERLTDGFQDCETHLLGEETHWLLYRQWHAFAAQLTNE